MLTPKGDIVVTGCEQHSFRSLNVKVFIKTFKVLPKLAIFRSIITVSLILCEKST